MGLGIPWSTEKTREPKGISLLTIEVNKKVSETFLKVTDSRSNGQLLQLT